MKGEPQHSADSLQLSCVSGQKVFSMCPLFAPGRFATAAEQITQPNLDSLAFPGFSRRQSLRWPQNFSELGGRGTSWTRFGEGLARNGSRRAPTHCVFPCVFFWDLWVPIGHVCVCVCLSLPYLKVRGSSLTNRLQLAPTDNHVCSIQNVPFPAWCRRERPVWKLGLRVPTRKSLCQRILYEGSLLNAGSEPKRGEKIQKLRRRGGHVRCSYRGGLRRGGP